MEDFPEDLLPVRIKDIVDFEGVRENMLIGYGLVVGLKNTGDNPSSSPFMRESLVSMLERLGVNTRDKMRLLKTKNVASVMVTAKLHPFAKQGSKIDVSVSAMGDAKSLNGGVLLVTPLVGADSEIYAVAQGAIATSGYDASGSSGTSVTKGVPTNAVISSGAIVEREVAFSLKDMKKMRVSLKNPDFTTARRIADAINTLETSTKKSIAEALDTTSVMITIPPEYQENPSGLISKLERLYVVPDQVARVILDEKEGVIVMGEHVRISTVAIAQGNLTIQISESSQISQPGSFSSGTTEKVEQSDVEVTESGKKMIILPSGVTLGELVKGLNAFGVTPRDMAAILRAIKAAGAMQAELEIR
ncbi:MAG: flagellar basal body P-ring protein FlgI [Holosporales bacterium]|nr:flagellar basal body P-ring protein FlgI [Holosporales bacterium]